MKIKCMVVDDEPLARKILRNYIAKLSTLELVQECDSAVDAAAYLHSNDVDLIFLDIKMPEMTGMELLETLEDPPVVIITTAYSEFALEGYVHSVKDYLLKPISLDRFLKAVNKALKTFHPVREVQAGTGDYPAEEFIFFRADKVENKVKLSDIHCVEGSGNFVKIHLGEEMITVPETMNTMEAGLPPEAFMRVHKSFIVAVKKITRIQGNKLYLDNMEVPIGKYYKKDVEIYVAAHRIKD